MAGLTAFGAGTAQVRFWRKKTRGISENCLAVSRDLSPVVVMETTSTNARPALYISEGGEISCLPHTPYPGSDSWYGGQWHAMTAADARDYERGTLRGVACARCLALARKAAS